MALLIFIAEGCKKKSGVPKPDVSDIEADIHIIRFEKNIMQANENNYRLVLDSLQKNYPEFFDLYTQDILTMPFNDTSYNVYDTLYKYMITDKYMLRLFDSVEHLYADMNDVEEKIEDAFKYYKYYFSQDTLPQIYTYIAPFVYQVVMGDSVIGIELNMFMGKNFAYYSSFAANLPQYILYNFERRNIPVQVMRMMMDKKIPNRGAEATLLDDMVAEGKMLYYLDLVLPDTPDSVKIGFTEKQITWCEENAEDTWKFLAGEDLLFSTSIQDKQRYLTEAPTSYNMPKESPGRTTIWVGWQIVREYMRKNPQLSLQELLNETDGLKILKESNYDGK
ncbi:MAG: hypothetical protein H7Y00_15105 [Fimbriimonadaceae bacterium]|nr:hypothetical protein [Chitinophagales bacterium]